uniref:Uncharacterized protein n=1 Tax=Tanacetum cinerariifolium TaxID=118510 RepID=A0A6L2KCK7_TANCI|nr:hypothetical protein [Tanacetum cinerariifolium]
MEADEDDNSDDVAKIFKIKGNLFDIETPLCKALCEFKFLLKINTDLFTFDVQEIKTYEEHEYELTNNITGDLDKPWNYRVNNADDTQDNQGYKKEHEGNEHTLTSKPTHDPSVCRVKRFEMIKYSFVADDDYRLNPCYAIKECSSCGTLYTRDCSCSKGNVEDKILVPKPPKNCARCGHPVDGSTNVVNIPLKPFVVKQDHKSFVDKIICGLNKAPDSPHLYIFSPNQFHCFHCNDALGDGEACQRCTCKRYRSGLSKGLCLICENNQNSPMIPQDRVFKIKDAFGNEQYKLKDVQELFHKLLNDVQNIHEELAKYINTPVWNRPAFYNNGDDDDVDYTIAITTVLSTEEPNNSLSMGDEHLDTIPATKSDEVIKSSVEDLVLIPSESKGIPDTIYDDSLYYENIEYVEASPYDSELVSLEAKKIVIPKDEEIEDDNLREKLLKISSGSTTTHSDISLSEYEAFSFYDDHIEEISSGSTTTQSNISLPEYDSFILDLSNDQFPPTDRSDFTHEEFGNELTHIISPSEYDCFYFRNFPDLGERISILNSEIRENPSSTTCVNLPVEDDHSPLLPYVVWIFLAYLRYPVIPPHLHSFGNKDTIFDPGITINRFYSSKLGLSHRCGTFKKFNTHRSHLNESPMEMLFSTLLLMDQ